MHSFWGFLVHMVSYILVGNLVNVRMNCLSSTHLSDWLYVVSTTSSVLLHLFSWLPVHPFLCSPFTYSALNNSPLLFLSSSFFFLLLDCLWLDSVIWISICDWKAGFWSACSKHCKIIQFLCSKTTLLSELNSSKKNKRRQNLVTAVPLSFIVTQPSLVKPWLAYWLKHSPFGKKK